MNAIATPCSLADETATLEFGAQLATAGLRSELVFLHGDLGVGKTTLVRGMLQALGHQGAVKSPTYTLLESYDLSTLRVFHFDFYRIFDPRELDCIGIDELLDEPVVKLVEWPAKAGDKLPAADIDVWLSVAGTGRHVALADHR